MKHIACIAWLVREAVPPQLWVVSLALTAAVLAGAVIGRFV